MNPKFDKLHKGIPFADLKAHRDKLKEGHVGDTSNPETLKMEVNAMTSLMTEEVWTIAKQWIEAHPNEIVVADLSNQQLEDMTFTTITYEKYFADNIRGQDIYKKAMNLAKITFTTLFMQTQKWQNQKKLLQQNTDEARQFNRYIDLVKQKEGKLATPLTEIGKGLVTASETMWAVLSVIPKVYERQFKKPISKNEYLLIAKNALTLVSQIAQLHVGIFGELEDKYSSENHDVTTIGRLPKPENFMITKEGQDLNLSLKDNVFDNTKEETRIGVNLRTGCPAIFSKGANKKT